MANIVAPSHTISQKPQAAPRVLKPLGAACFFALLCFLALTLGANTAAGKSRKAPSEKRPQEEMQRLTPQELTGMLMAFSDIYMEEILESVNEVLAAPSLSPDQRLYFERIKAYYLMGAITNACQANPQTGLLDMMTMVTLQRIVWEDPAVWKYAGKEHAEDMLVGLKELEQDIWEIASQTLTANEIQDMRELILKWRKNHPNEQYVAFIRFQDFAPSRIKDTLGEAVSSWGLLAPINDASREIHESRMLAERSLFLIKRLPMLAQWYGALITTETLTMPEIRSILADFHKGVAGVQDIGDALKGMPDLAKEQEAFFRNFQSLLANERKLLFQDLEGQHEALTTITSLAGAAARDLRLAFETLERMTNSFEPSSQNEPSGLDKMSHSLDKLSGVTQNLNTLVARLDALLEKTDSVAKNRALAEIDAMFDRRERHVAAYTAGLLFLTFVLALIFVFIVRRKR